jgi:hypothetical protein
VSAFLARYPGTCQDCGDTFEAGEFIRYDDDDQVVHNRCRMLRKPAELCTVCFLEKPCPCEDGQ